MRVLLFHDDVLFRKELGHSATVYEICFVLTGSLPFLRLPCSK